MRNKNEFWKYWEISEEIAKRLSPLIVNKYKDKLNRLGGTLDTTWNLQLPSILYCLNGKLKGKKILDLGCGSYPTTDGMFMSWQPWLCRALLEIESKPIGIDIGNLSFEEFEHYQLDLTKPDALDFLPDKSIDLANASQLVNSPFLFRYCRKLGYGEINLLETLTPQLERIIRPEGVLIYSDDRFI